MLERFSCLVPASTTCRAVAVAKADQLSSDGHPAMQDELSATEDGTNVVFFIPLWMTAIISNPERFRETLKSRWQQPRTLSGLREITRTFRSEK